MKKLIKVLLSLQLADILDKNKDGRISLSEIKSATLNDWFLICQEIVFKAMAVFEITKLIK